MTHFTLVNSPFFHCSYLELALQQGEEDGSEHPRLAPRQGALDLLDLLDLDEHRLCGDRSKDLAKDRAKTTDGFLLGEMDVCVTNVTLF